jgi:hypothetical protein
LKKNFHQFNSEIHKEKEMVDFRKWFPALAVAAMFAATASAQNTPSLTCTSNAGTTPLVRSQGLAELVGDVVLNCTGGTPTPAGVPVPQVNIQIFLNTNITSRLVESGGTWSEGLILIDDPAPANQIACSTGSGCSVTGVGGGGVNFKSGGVTNVYQARTGGANSLIWLGVPIDPPGSNGTRTIRITNVRANANALGTSSTLIPTQIQMFISITPPQSLPLNNPQQTVAFVANGLSFALRKADNSDSLASGGATYLQCVSNNKDAFADPTKAFTNTGGTVATTAAFLARFREGFASAFKRRNIAVDANSGTAPTPVAQDAPGGVCSAGSVATTVAQCPANNYFTETGFYNPLLSNSRGISAAGLADSGTRLMLRFSNVPAGLTPFVSTTDINGKARLITTDANGAGPSLPGVGAGYTVTANTNTTTGIGPYAPVTITNGSGVAVYEFIAGDPLATEDVLVPVVLAYTSNTSASPALPALGTATISGSFAPLSTTTTQSISAPLPRFADSPTTGNGFVINPCQTNLLFPFVTNQAGFDTGVAISNTSLDPFGTATQQGTCTMYYYGNTNGGAAPAAATSPVVPAGTTLVFLLSSGGSGVAATPGFQGYMISRCNFQYAHGFAFISDVGANKVAEGYLALILDAGIGTRTGFLSEVLAH